VTEIASTNISYTGAEGVLPVLFFNDSILIWLKNWVNDRIVIGKTSSCGYLCAPHHVLTPFEQRNLFNITIQE